MMINIYFGDKFVHRSELNLSKPPFGNVLICEILRLGYIIYK